ERGDRPGGRDVAAMERFVAECDPGHPVDDGAYARRRCAEEEDPTCRLRTGGGESAPHPPVPPRGEKDRERADVGGRHGQAGNDGRARMRDPEQCEVAQRSQQGGYDRNDPGLVESAWRRSEHVGPCDIRTAAWATPAAVKPIRCVTVKSG